MTDKELLQMTDDELLRLPEVRAAYKPGPWKHQYSVVSPCERCGSTRYLSRKTCPVPPYITDPIEVVAEVLEEMACRCVARYEEALKVVFVACCPTGEGNDSAFHDWLIHLCKARHGLIAALLVLQEAEK